MIRTPDIRAALSAVVVCLTSCASAADRFEDGLALESEGRYLEAAFRYVDALDKDPELGSARETLEIAGRRAVEAALEQAGAQLAGGSPEAGARPLIDVDELIARAAEVGLSLPLPEDYGDRRRATFDGAIEAAIGEAVRDERLGRWDAAVDAYGRVLALYDPSPRRFQEARDLQRDALISWATEELDRQRYRSAFDLATRAAAEGATAQQEVRIAAIKQEALDLGTLLVAVLTATVSGSAPREFALELSDLLEVEFWDSSPLFIEVLDGAPVRRSMRRLAVDGAQLRDGDVGAVVRDLGADLGVVIDLHEVAVEETDLRREVHEARLETGLPARWTEERGRLSYDVRASYAIVDDRGWQITERSVRASASERFERGLYEGDLSALDLSRSERRLFDPAVSRAERRAVEEEAIQELAQDLAEDVYEHLERSVR